MFVSLRRLVAEIEGDHATTFLHPQLQETRTHGTDCGEGRNQRLIISIPFVIFKSLQKWCIGAGSDIGVGRFR